MTTDDRVMAILERANPVPPGDLVDVPVGATRYLETALEQRSEPMTVDPTPNRTPDRPPRRWPLIAVAASVVAIVVASIAIVVANRADDTVVDQPTPTVVEPPPTTAAAPDPTAAQATIDAFLAAHNDGDTDGALALMSSDAIMTFAFHPTSPGPGNDRLDAELHLAWKGAQGEMWAEPSCSEIPTQQPETTMSCRWDTLDALIRAVDGEPIPTEALIVVNDDLIGELHLGFGTPDFDALGVPFGEWMATSNPEVEGAECCSGDTRGESERRGELLAHWAGEWASWLEEQGCEPTNCRTTTAEFVAEYDARCTALEPPDLPTVDFVEQIRRLPSMLAPSELLTSRQTLLDADAALLATELTDARISELQQGRRDAMIELGIDARCHPVVE